MREKELRLALVFFGGVSLAVYMHGISKEILKLVRASSALHAILDRRARAGASFSDTVERDDREHDTEPVYFDLLRQIGGKIDLRVVVDIIAGASAGGINGVMLARALAHDLPMGRLRELWLEEADVTELLARESRASAWSKWVLRPFIWGAGRTAVLRATGDPEMRRKLSLFVRSRWFRPPFDGLRMTELMLDAVRGMGAPRHPASSLLPASQRLDLFITLTDFFGYQQLIQLHDPPVIREREHRHVLRFGYRRRAGGEVESDFGLDDAPALAFAARATSAFPGAFPPAQIGEVDRLLAIKGLYWPGRARFLERNFERYARAGHDPQMTSFVDGSVLNNKPFTAAIQAIRGRPAYREVDRRLVYVDPDPIQPSPPSTGQVPGFFTTLKGALSDIPRNEPIADELEWVADFNDRVRRLKAIVDAARPQISQFVVDIAPCAVDQPFTAPEIRRWREAVNFRVAENAGFAYEGYVRLKLASARLFVCHLVASLCDLPGRSPPMRAVSEIIDAWARLRGVVYGEGESHALHREAQQADAPLPPWVTFLLRFDAGFRQRRLSFLIQGLNRLYESLGDAAADGGTAALINRLKRDFYDCLEELNRRQDAQSFSPEARRLARALFAEAPAPEDTRRITAYARDFAQRRAGQLDALIERLAAEVDLDVATHDIDVLLGRMDHTEWKPELRREVLINYLGFPFWDVLTLSVTNWRDAGEFDEIRIDRISPEDAHTLRASGADPGLMGTSLGHFGAFFSRRHRENDYLLGRLHAVDRLIDIVCDAAGAEPGGAEPGGAEPGVEGIDIAALKRRAFEIILAVEEPHLTQCAALIARLRRELAGRG